MIVNVWYVSVWDGGVEIKTPCLFDEDSKRCYEIRESEEDVAHLDSLDAEFVELSDGTRLNEDDGVTFDY